MADKDSLSRFVEARDRFVRTAMFLSGLSILGAAASRIPTWEVRSPVEWLAGSVNVGFLPIFGPLLITFGYSYLYLAWRAVVIAARRLPAEAQEAGDPLGYGLVLRLNWKDVPAALALLFLRVWAFAVPVAAFVILLATYFDFCPPPGTPEGLTAQCTPWQRVLTLGVGTSGVTGFKPRMASIQDNLRELAGRQDKMEERARLETLADLVPWIYPPWQTWIYLACLSFISYLGIAACRRTERRS
jgi:hypothetical protein